MYFAVLSIISPGPILFIAGLLLVKFPPKKINALYGYRTSRSMKSQELWDIAQVLGGNAMTILGAIMTMTLLLISLFIPLLQLIITMLVLLTVGSIAMMIVTEKILKKRELELEMKPD